MLTSVSKYTESVKYTIYIYLHLGLWKLVSFLPGTGLISSCFYQQLTVATSCTSGTVNELSAFKNLFHLVCPYFTDHDLIANKSKFTESMQIIL